jgi:alpha-ketoglutarate-dependent taurine dioxygenase
MELCPLSGALGVELRGLDLAQPIDRALAAELRRTLDEHQLVCLRAPGLAGADQLRFAAEFGPIHDELGKFCTARRAERAGLPLSAPG